MYEESMVACRKALRVQPDNLFFRIRLVAAYNLLAHEEKSRTEAAEVLRINPKFSVERYAKMLPYKNQYHMELEINALRKAGLK
jgi:hypothetical protein